MCACDNYANLFTPVLEQNKGGSLYADWFENEAQGSQPIILKDIEA